MRLTYEHPDWLARSSVDIGATAHDLALEAAEAA
jgi:hypothetical protein